MDTLQKEIAELKEFIVELKADRAATKEKERRESWLKFVSVSLVFIAVTAAVAAQWSGKYGSMSQSSQAQASDQWAYYQAKSIKQHVDAVAAYQLKHGPNAADPEVVREIKRLEDEVGRYQQDQDKIKSDAQALEQKRDDASKRGSKVGLALAIFSVAIATGSICTMTKKKPLWFAALGLAAVAIIEMLMARA